MRNEISLMFNTHKVYRHGFLNEINSELNNVIIEDENLIVYENNQLEIMIDKSGPVYISLTVDEDEALKDNIKIALGEYKKLIDMDKRFELKYPFKIITPKLVSNSVKASLKSLNFDYIHNEMNNEDSILVYSS